MAGDAYSQGLYCSCLYGGYAKADCIFHDKHSTARALCFVRMLLCYTYTYCYFNSIYTLQIYKEWLGLLQQRD
jgi:hypothetical protein